jgi:hypothetical protein
MPEEEKESNKYTEAEAVELLARELLPVHHPEIASANIKFVFRTKASSKNGRPVMGTVRKVSGVMKYLTDIDFLMEVAMDVWNTLSGEQRRALVDHLLERCTGDENENDPGGSMKWKLREPDVHEFSSILSRYGAWNDDLLAFQTAFQHGIDLHEIANGTAQQLAASA